jgi:large subunit ribosomal protein L19
LQELYRYITSSDSNKITFDYAVLNKEAVEKVCPEREIPEVQPGCMIQMRLVISFLHVPALALFGYVSGTDPSGE